MKINLKEHLSLTEKRNAKSDLLFSRKRNRRRCAAFRNTEKGLAFILPSFAGVCIFWLIPYVDVIRRSFCGAVNGEFVGNQVRDDICKQSVSSGSRQHTSVLRSVCAAAGGIVSDHSSPACRAEKIYADSEKFLSSANGNPCSISGTSVETAFLTIRAY